MRGNFMTIKCNFNFYEKTSRGGAIAVPAVTRLSVAVS